MDTLKKTLEQREKPELIAIITHMLRQEPDVQWLLTTPLPIATSRKEPAGGTLQDQSMPAETRLLAVV